MGFFTLFFFFGESAHLLELALLVSAGQTDVFLLSLIKLYTRYWLSISGFIVPMAILLGSMLTLSRLQEDKELLAFETLGININAFLRYLMIGIGLFFLLIQFPLVGRHMPKARFYLKRFAYQSKNLIQNFKLEAGAWQDLGTARLLAKKANGNHLTDVTLYVSKSHAEKNDSSQVYRVLGQSAHYEIIREDAQHANLKIRFTAGSLDYPNREKPGDITICEFTTYENSIPLSYSTPLVRTWREHTNLELKKILSNPSDYQVTKMDIRDIRFEYESRLSLIFASLALAIVSVYASQRFRALTRGFGFGLALALLAFYWITMVASASFQLPWLTNIAYLGVTLPILALLR